MSGRRSPYRLRFSITFLLSLTLGSAMFVCHFFVIRPELERRRLIDEVRSLGGKVDFEDGQSLSLFKSQKIASMTLEQSSLERITPSRLRSFGKLPSVTITNYDLRIEAARLTGDKIELELNDDDSYETLANYIGLRPPASTDAPSGTLRVRDMSPPRITLQDPLRLLPPERDSSRGEPRIAPEQRSAR